MEDENFGSHCLGKVRTFLWNLMEYPETSRYAQVILPDSVLHTEPKKWLVHGLVKFLPAVP